MTCKYLLLPHQDKKKIKRASVEFLGGGRSEVKFLHSVSSCGRTNLINLKIASCNGISE